MWRICGAISGIMDKQIKSCFRSIARNNKNQCKILTKNWHVQNKTDGLWENIGRRNTPDFSLFSLYAQWCCVCFACKEFALLPRKFRIFNSLAVNFRLMQTFIILHDSWVYAPQVYFLVYFFEHVRRIHIYDVYFQFLF